jgi:Na+/glutamate symporter
MGQKILSLAMSIGAIILGLGLSQKTNRVFYGLVLAGILYGIYDIYLIITHKQKTQKEQEARRKLSEQKAFNNESSSENTNKTSDKENVNTESATIIVHWFKEKMGLGSLPIYVNGQDAGIIKKDNLKVTYHTNVSFNVINMGIYRSEIELSPGDTVEYFVAGNGIRSDRTIITKNVK